MGFPKAQTRAEQTKEDSQRRVKAIAVEARKNHSRSVREPAGKVSVDQEQAKTETSSSSPEIPEHPHSRACPPGSLWFFYRNNFIKAFEKSSEGQHFVDESPEGTVPLPDHLSAWEYTFSPKEHLLAAVFSTACYNPTSEEELFDKIGLPSVDLLLGYLHRQIKDTAPEEYKHFKPTAIEVLGAINVNIANDYNWPQSRRIPPFLQTPKELAYIVFRVLNGFQRLLFGSLYRNSAKSTVGPLENPYTLAWRGATPKADEIFPLCDADPDSFEEFVRQVYSYTDQIDQLRRVYDPVRAIYDREGNVTIFDAEPEKMPITRASETPMKKWNAKDPGTVRADGKALLYDEPYHPISRDVATWPPKGVYLSSLWTWAVVTTTFIPGTGKESRYSYWPSVFHSKTGLQATFVNRGLAAKVQSHTDDSRTFYYPIIFGFAQMHGEEGKGFELDQSEHFSLVPHNNHEWDQGHRCKEQVPMPTGRAKRDREVSTDFPRKRKKLEGDVAVVVAQLEQEVPASGEKRDQGATGGSTGKKPHRKPKMLAVPEEEKPEEGDDRDEMIATLMKEKEDLLNKLRIAEGKVVAIATLLEKMHRCFDTLMARMGLLNKLISKAAVFLPETKTPMQSKPVTKAFTDFKLEFDTVRENRAFCDAESKVINDAVIAVTDSFPNMARFTYHEDNEFEQWRLAKSENFDKLVEEDDQELNAQGTLYANTL